MLTLAQLAILRAAVDAGSFAAAAAELDYTPSAISQQIRAMERSTGVVLFERFPRSVHPTSAALFLADSAREVTHAAAALERDARALANGETGRIRLGSFQTANARILPHALREFQLCHPRVFIELEHAQEPAEVVPALVDGLVDIALVYESDFDEPRSWPRQTARLQLCAEDRFLIMPPNDAATTDPTSLASLSEKTWIASDPSPNLLHLCRQVGFRPRVALRTNDYYSVCAMVRQGLGVAIVPRLGHYMRSSLPPHRVDPEPPQRRVFAMWRRRNPNPLIEPMLETLKEAAAAAMATATDGPSKSV